MKPITNTFILVAPDCGATTGIIPPAKPNKPTLASIQYELLVTKPYTFTLEDLIFETHLRRQGLSKSEAKSRAAEIRAEIFAKPHPCMRASPLPKTYGWGVHHDSEGRIALHAIDSPEYQQFALGTMLGLQIVYAMRSKRE